ncbi:hypothetical protein Tco_1102225 [Tanacetum coccineum]
MMRHFKQQWEQMEKSAEDEFEDVLDEVAELARNISNDYLFGMDETHGMSEKEEARIMEKYSTALQDEESFLCQQAKIEWLKDGDKNSKFFHAILKSRNHKSRVVAISNENGEMFEGDKVPEQFVNHFQKFLGSLFTVKEMGDNLIPEICVSSDAASDMIKTVSNKREIKAGSAIFGILLGEVNATSISLIPKLETPSKISDFRLIACCNVIYKCIKALDEFNMLSGLVLKILGKKSTVFFGNLNNLTKQEIIDVMPFKVGSLPVTYLGVPLITKQNRIGDCKCLVDKLIQYVLSSIHVYWALVFLLLKMTIKDVNKLLKGFL